MAEVKIGRITLGVCTTNVYFLYREGNQQVVVIDPAERGKYLYETLKNNGFYASAILLTHGHGDHIMGIDDMIEAAKNDNIDIKVYADEAELSLLGSAGKNLSKSFGNPVTITPDVALKDGAEVNLCDITFKMISTPGHTEGGCCYYVEEAGFLISGDTLFEESVGRTDFPTGSMSTLVRSIQDKLFILPEETKVYPGHGGSTTIGHEKKYNPFCGSEA